VDFVLFRTITEGMNAQTPVNSRDEFQEDWRDNDKNECGPGRDE
jgi:hypothetical protein